MRKGKQEIELKIKLKNPKKMRSKLRSLGAKRRDKFQEIDVYFDTPTDDLLKGDRVLRLRRHGSISTVTYKDKREKNRRLHKRVEIEVQIKNFEEMVLVLQGLGLKKRDTIEKIREVYEYKEVEILIDKLPFIGYWLEIEGPKERILAVAQKLGIDPNKGETRNYGELFWAYCQKHGLPLMKKMMFKKEKEVKDQVGKGV
jgi:adenylate cyclase class 2